MHIYHLILRQIIDHRMIIPLSIKSLIKRKKKKRKSRRQSPAAVTFIKTTSAATAKTDATQYEWGSARQSEELGDVSHKSASIEDVRCLVSSVRQVS